MREVTVLDVGRSAQVLPSKEPRVSAKYWRHRSATLTVVDRIVNHINENGPSSIKTLREALSIPRNSLIAALYKNDCLVQDKDQLWHNEDSLDKTFNPRNMYVWKKIVEYLKEHGPQSILNLSVALLADDHTIRTAIREHRNLFERKGKVVKTERMQVDLWGLSNAN